MAALPGSFPVSTDDGSKPTLVTAAEETPAPAAASASADETPAVAAETPAAAEAQQERKPEAEGEPKKKRKLVRVLSIDGGGVRGIIPAVVLSYIERRTHKRISDLFDLVCGTSTGALLAAILSIPDEEKKGRPKFTASQCISLYEKECSKIFSKTLMGNLSSGWGLFDIAYSTKGRNEVYEKYVGDLHLSDMLTDLLITSYDMKERRPFFFKSRNAREDRIFDYPMQTVLQSTSAAPTYFEPTRVEYRPSAYVSPTTSPYTMIDKWGNEEKELNSAREFQKPRKGSQAAGMTSPRPAADADFVVEAAPTETKAPPPAEAHPASSETHLRRTESAVYTSTTVVEAKDGEIVETKTTTVLEETQDITTTTTVRPPGSEDTKSPPVTTSASDSSDRYRCLIDGGTFANNPAMCGHAEALRHYKEEEDVDVLVVSLGTGTCYSPYSYEEAKSWGMIGWARPILDIMLDGQANTVDYQLNQLLGADGLYFRFDTFIAAANSTLDDSRDINMAYLRSKGEEIVENRREELDRVCELLMQGNRMSKQPLGRFWWEHSFPSQLEEQDEWSLIA